MPSLRECSNPVCSEMTPNAKYCSRSCSATVTGSTHPKRRQKILSLSRDELAEAVVASETVADLIRRLGWQYRTASYVKLRELVDAYEIDVSHFKGQGWSKGRTRTLEERRHALFERCARGGKSPSATELISVGLKERRCERCKRTTWEGEPIPLQCDHVDGDRTNNDPSNWMLLCGNCHMLTPTWGNKKWRVEKRQARVVEQVDTPGSGPGALTRRAGSTPVAGT